MGNRRASVAAPPFSAGAPLAAPPGAAVAWAVPPGDAVPDEPSHAATSAAVMPAPRQARSTRRAPPLPSVIAAENSPRAGPDPPEAGNPDGAYRCRLSLLQITPRARPPPAARHRRPGLRPGNVARSTIVGAGETF